MKNRLLALLLTLVMLLSMVVVPASADESENALSFSAISFTTDNKGNLIEGDKLDKIEAGQVFALKVSLQNLSNTQFTVGACTLIIRYNEKALKGYTFSYRGSECGPVMAGDFSMVEGTLNGSILKFAAIDSGILLAPKGEEYSSVTIGYVMFEANEAVETGNLEFTVVEGDNFVVSDTKENMPSVSFDDINLSIPVNGTDPVLSRVTVSTDKAGNEVILSSDKVDGAQDYTVTVDGKTVSPYDTYYAHAYSLMGTDITKQVTWTIGDGQTEYGGTSIADTGTIIVSGKAAGIETAIKAALNGVTVSAGGFTVQRTAESENTVTELKISPDNAEVYVPAAAPNTQDFSAQALNVYGDPVSDASITWTVLNSDGKEVARNWGILFEDSSQGKLTVNRSAMAHPGSYKVRAAADNAVATVTLTIMLENSVPTGYTLDEGAVTTFAVPTADADGNEREQSYVFPAVTVIDQYGEEMPGAAVTWDSYDELPDGVSVRDGKLYVSSSAAANSFTDGKLEFNVSLRFGSFSPSQALTLTRDASQATSVTVSGGPTEALLVPGTGEAAATGAPFTAVVKDQYGQAMTDAAVSWSVGRKNPTLGSDGVSIDDGSVTVSDAAAATVTDTNAVTFAATATSGSASGSKEFTVARAEPVATSITVARKGFEDTLLIPGLDSTETTRDMEFVATVKDQYGADIQNPSINWSISCGNYKIPDGVTIDPDTGVVSVTIDAAKTIDDSMEHYIFTVTAAVNGTEIEDSTQTFKVKREDIRMIGFHLYATKDGEKDTPLTDNSTAIIADGTDFLFASWPYSQYGEEYTWPSIGWQVEIFAPDNSRAIPADTDKSTDSDPSYYCTKLPITSDIKDGTYRILITETNPAGATPINSEYSIKLMRKLNAGLTISGGDDAASKTVTYGVTFTLTATAANHDTTGSKWGLSGIDSTILDTVNHNGNQVTLKARKAGTTTFTMTYEDDTYYGSVTYAVTVSPKEVTAVLVNGVKVSKAYDGTTAGGSVLPNNISAPVQLTGVISTDELTVAPTLTGAYSTKDVHTGATNEFSLTLTLSGAAAGNYRLKNSSVAIPSEITPKPVRISGLTFESRQFAMNDSSAAIDTLTFDGVVSGETLAYETGLIRVANNNVGTQSVEAFTVTLKNDNYCWTADVVGSTLTIPAGTYSVVITKAPYSDKTAETGAKFGNSASFPLKSDLFPAGANVQSITVTAPTGSIFDGTPSVTGTTLNYKIAANAKPGQTGTLTLAVESQNYNNYNITITVTVLDKTPQAIEAKNVTMIYGDTASGYVTNLSSLKGAVSYTLSNGRDVISVDSSTGRITALKPGEALISIYAAGDENTKDANKVITVTVTKRPLTVTANNISTYVGDKQPTLTYRFDGLVNNDNVGTWELTLSIPANVKDPMKTAGEYPIIFGVHTDGTDEDKYDITLVPGKLTVTNYTIIDSTPLGSDITVIPAPGGTTRISTPKAVGGATVMITVTPDKDKELKSLEVIDENGSRLPLTDLGNGRFSFVMPAGKVSVSVVYGDVNDYVNPYLDVNESDWYYEAVKYVTVNGLMNGTGASRFEPNLATSRAMIWTILARMSGVDTTGGSVWYAAAQQWAIATGVSDGTNPNGTITREQLAAMLYRYAVSKGMVTAPVTADLSIYSDAASVSAYAVEAMQWAVGTGLINGMAGKLNPQGSATRAQVATMLMRFAQLSK